MALIGASMVPRSIYIGVWYEDNKRKTTPEYRAWQNMRNRCNNPNGHDYRHYGGRGITVCQAWDSFRTFVEDMGVRPSNKHTLDRIDTDGNYNPTNCRWATRREQARNRNYATTKSWVLAERLGIKVSTANHMIWQVRNKFTGAKDHFSLSPEAEATVVGFLEEISAWH